MMYSCAYRLNMKGNLKMKPEYAHLIIDHYDYFSRDRSNQPIIEPIQRKDW